MDYPNRIRKALAKNPKLCDASPVLVEHWMRLQYGTLDHLDTRTFNREARLGAELVVSHPVDTAGCAASYGMKPAAIAAAMNVEIEVIHDYLKTDKEALGSLLQDLATEGLEGT